MSPLVDYEDSSSDEEDVVLAADHKESLPPPPQQQKPSRNTQRCLNQKVESDKISKLPDALFLLESPRLAHASGRDHASVVAAAMAESALRKRDFDLKSSSSSSLPRRSKLPRGNLPHSKNIPETLRNTLVPPQLKGRSNVATEDISRLFVKKRQESFKTRSPNQD
ncbi:unnamed protein product [Cochlearia groenlandica]